MAEEKSEQEKQSEQTAKDEDMREDFALMIQGIALGIDGIINNVKIPADYILVTFNKDLHEAGIVSNISDKAGLDLLASAGLELMSKTAKAEKEKKIIIKH
jgi:hypothetical protein